MGSHTKGTGILVANGSLTGGGEVQIMDIDLLRVQRSLSHAYIALSYFTGQALGSVTIGSHVRKIFSADCNNE